LTRTGAPQKVIEIAGAEEKEKRKAKETSTTKEAAKTVPIVSYCPKCGVALRPNTSFCHKCGTLVSKSEKAK
jgi:uncharacterized OB-fold protein